MKTHVTLNLTFAGVILPIQEHEGRDYVPLKPISDVFGLRWRQQKAKLLRAENVQIYEALGLPRGGDDGRKEDICIPIENIFGWFFSINPSQVRTQGNEKGADFLIAKRREWQKVLLDYEMATGGMVKPASDRLKKMSLLVSVSRTMHQHGSDPYLKAVQRELGDDIGIDIHEQQELPTGTEA